METMTPETCIYNVLLSRKIGRLDLDATDMEAETAKELLEDVKKEKVR